MSKKEIEAKAGEMGVDLSRPYARAYVKAVLEGERQPDPRECEPSDASGYTQDFEILVIGAR